MKAELEIHRESTLNDHRTKFNVGQTYRKVTPIWEYNKGIQEFDFQDTPEPNQYVVLEVPVSLGKEKLAAFSEILTGEIERAFTGKDEPRMDWQEKYLDKLDRDITDMKNAIASSEERISKMIDSTMTELRERDKQRHQEIIELRSSFQATSRWIIGLIITTGLGFVSMVLTVVLAVFRK